MLYQGHFRLTGYAGRCEIAQPRTDPDNRLATYTRVGVLTERLTTNGAEVGAEHIAEGHGTDYISAVQNALLNAANPNALLQTIPRVADPVVRPDGTLENYGFITDPPHRGGGRTVYSCSHREQARTIVITAISEELGGSSRPDVTVRFSYRFTEEPAPQLNHP